jgi:hypothetical protein
MRFAWLLVALASAGCSDVSTSNYAVAAAFAATAGALQIAQAVDKGKPSASCGPATCNGCCDLADQCVGGTDDHACGVGGGVCRDCIATSHWMCSEGACADAVGASSQVPAVAPPLRASAPSPPLSCRQLFITCFVGTHAVCGTDPSGCPACTCEPDGVWDLRHR